MKASYALLAIANVIVLLVTAWVGLVLHDQQGIQTFTRHFLLGLLSGFITCFVHIVLFMYFVVQAKIFEQSILHDHLDAESHERALQYKSRALVLSAIGIVSILAAALTGPAIGIIVGEKVHLTMAIISIVINAVVFTRQYALIVSYGEFRHVVFGE